MIDHDFILYTYFIGCFCGWFFTYMYNQRKTEKEINYLEKLKGIEDIVRQLKGHGIPTTQDLQGKLKSDKNT